MKILRATQMIKRILAVGFLTMLTACNTVAGFGEDITASAEWTKQKIGSPSRLSEDQKNSPSQSGAPSSGKASVEIGGPIK